MKYFTVGYGDARSPRPPVTLNLLQNDVGSFVASESLMVIRMQLPANLRYVKKLIIRLAYTPAGAG
jgi:hypothetical protein